METPTFNFFHHWYPIVPLEDLDPDHPIAVVLLGQRMVIWKPRFDPHIVTGKQIGRAHV